MVRSRTPSSARRVAASASCSPARSCVITGQWPRWSPPQGRSPPRRSTRRIARPEPVLETRRPPREITATLASLTDMKEAGTITEADFEAKKKELLDRL